MKRNLLTLLMMLVMKGVIAQTTIICNAEGELPELLAEKAKGLTELVIRGVVGAEDIRAINNYPKIKSLDLTEVKLSVIPSRSWDNLHSLRALYLPKTIDTLYLDAISCDVSWINIYLPGKFPHLKNYPIDCERGISYFWNVVEGNDLLVIEEGDEEQPEIGGGIFSADKKILYAALEKDGYLSGLKEYAVEKVWDYAFSTIFGVNSVDIMFHRIKEIANTAFCDFVLAVTTRNTHYDGYLYIHLITDTPPQKFGEGNLNHNVKCSDEDLIFVVSDKDLYIQDDPSWGELNLMDENGIHWGTKIEGTTIADNILSTDNTLPPYYDLLGRPVANPEHGIYVKEGRKVVIK